MSVRRRIVAPSLVELVFLAVFLAAFARPAALQALLFDGDTGWHIRTGQLVLASGSVPRVDGFSFTRAGQPWFAWEWLSDVLFAVLYGWRGISAVAALAGVVLSLAAAALFARLLRRGDGLWLALAATLAACSASSVHYLARPHVFSILFYTVSLWVLEEDRRTPRALLWLLPPLAALWANLHAGFVILPATLFLLAVCEGWRRYLPVALAASAATLVNPYGWRLHQHVWQYLHAPWILEHVQEFQSPNIRTEGMVVFALMLLGAVAVAARASRFDAALVLIWGFAALRSARHVPFFAIAAAPVLSGWCAQRWRDFSTAANRRAPARIFWELGCDLGRVRFAGAWLPAAAVLVMLLPISAPGFPDSRFPVRAVSRNEPILAPAGPMPRVLTSDQWADYLIFKLYPRQRVFFDGRSDFYGAALGGDYRQLLAAEGPWRVLLDRYAFDLALLPNDWPLSTFLSREPGWHEIYRDPVATLFAKDTAGTPRQRVAAERPYREPDRHPGTTDPPLAAEGPYREPDWHAGNTDQPLAAEHPRRSLLDPHGFDLALSREPRRHPGTTDQATPQRTDLP